MIDGVVTNRKIGEELIERRKEGQSDFADEIDQMFGL
jgi:hypothetical protein